MLIELQSVDLNRKLLLGRFDSEQVPPGELGLLNRQHDLGWLGRVFWLLPEAKGGEQLFGGKEQESPSDGEGKNGSHGDIG